MIQDTPNQELHGFIERLAATEIGQATHREWQEWVATCECVWTPDTLSDEENFPTRRHHEGIREHCHIHGVIEACGDYLDLIDQDWRKIADWYHIDESVRRGVNPEVLYDRFRKDTPSDKVE